jgi:DNA-binding transcriptional LysR family regulator
VVDLGSFAAAARHLDLPAVTVAQRIHALEAALNSKLVVRSGRTVKATSGGLRVLERARRVLRDVRDLNSAASESALPAGPLRIGVIPTGMVGIMPLVLRTWVARYPDIEIYIDPGTTASLYPRVLAGDLDAALLVQPTFHWPKTCRWRSLRDEPLILLTPGDQIVDDPLETLAREPLIRYDRQVIAGKLADDYLSSRGVRPQVRFELDGIDYIAKLVAAGLGVSVLPDWAHLEPLDSALTKWRLPAPCPSRTVGVVWQWAAIRAPLAEAFVEVAEQVCKSARMPEAAAPTHP